MERSEGEDLRQRRTRRHLVNALLELLEEKSFREISVVDVCERAMVHRTTFYAHFEDKQALLRHALTAAARELETLPPGREDTGTRDFFLGVFRNVLDFMEGHQGLCRALADGGADPRMLEDLVDGELARILARPEFLERHPGLVPQVAARFYAGAILALIRWWLEYGKPVTDQVLLAHLEYFIPLPDGRAEKG